MKPCFQGAKGDLGTPGFPGSQGEDGLPGRNGIDGLPGFPGLPVSQAFSLNPQEPNGRFTTLMAFLPLVFS